MGCCVSKVEAENSQEAPTVRGCTDVLWLCLFIGFWFLMVSVNNHFLKRRCFNFNFP